MSVVTGVFVDAKQHVWVTELPEQLTEEELYAEQKPPMGTCCIAAPPVLEFDEKGKLVQGWGQGSKDDTSNWPRNPHGIFVDHNDFVWVGTYMHHRVMKFTRDGKLVMTIGQYDKNGGSNDTTLLGGPAGIWVDPKTNEVFIADGYRNRRVIVFDGATGKYLRHWGAYGEKPDDTEKFDPKTMAGGARCRSSFPRCTRITGSKDGKDRVYVADRRGNRRSSSFHAAGQVPGQRKSSPPRRSRPVRHSYPSYRPTHNRRGCTWPMEPTIGFGSCAGRTSKSSANSATADTRWDR